MDTRLHFVTIATVDLNAARTFYKEAFEWQPTVDVRDEILFFQVAPGFMLGFFDRGKFEEDSGLPGSGAAVSGVVLSHNVDSEDAVRTLVGRALAVGATVTKTPQPGAFGGIFHAQFTDPNGVLWEIAHNPGWHVADDGTVSFV